MRTALWTVLCATACGGAATSNTWTPLRGNVEPTIASWTSADEARYTKLACTNLVGPNGESRCRNLSQVGLGPMDCHSTLGRWWIETRDVDRRLVLRALVGGLTVAGSCPDVDATFQLSAMLVDVAVAKGCPGEDPSKRRGIADRSFADTVTSPDEAIEVCGIRGELEWLRRVVCADGSRPWGNDPDVAQIARNSWRGRLKGPRCGGPNTTSIDVFTAACPERRYTIYMDINHCAPSEQLFRPAQDR